MRPGYLDTLAMENGYLIAGLLLRDRAWYHCGWVGTSLLHTGTHLFNMQLQDITGCGLIRPIEPRTASRYFLRWVEQGRVRARSDGGPAIIALIIDTPTPI